MSSGLEDALSSECFKADPEDLEVSMREEAL